MSSICVQHRLCANDHAVPVDQKSLSFVDPYNLANEADEELAVSLVSFKATDRDNGKDKKWLEEALHVPARWYWCLMQLLPT